MMVQVRVNVHVDGYLTVYTMLSFALYNFLFFSFICATMGKDIFSSLPPSLAKRRPSGIVSVNLLSA